MTTKKIEYGGYIVEIDEHPIYHDYQFVIKTLDEKKVVGANVQLYEYVEDAEAAAFLIINNDL